MNYYKMGPNREIKKICNLNIHDLLNPTKRRHQIINIENMG
jgi:hypothetical protein